ncbi:SDR family NAD(P)-dependent oxidoreductase [Streptosporangium lutulentum]
MAEAVAPHGVPVVMVEADSTDQATLNAALDKAVSEHGVPDVVVYNAAIIQADAPGELSVRAHMEAWAVNVVGALNAAAHVAPAMAARGNGTFLITGGMPEPKPQYVSLSLGKAGVRTLVTLLDQEYGPSGVHVASVTVAARSPPAPTSTRMTSPSTIGGCTQPRHQWEREALHAGSSR